MNLQPEDDEICQEDYWIRRLFRERFDYTLRRLAPGSSRINPKYEVESISEIDGAIAVTYYSIATGYRTITTIPGDKNICKRYIIFEEKLNSLANKLENEGIDLKKHKDFVYWQEKFVIHREEDCDNIELHEMSVKDTRIAIPIKIELVKKPSEYSLVLYHDNVGDISNRFQTTANSANQVGIDELISFIEDILDNIKDDGFAALIEDEFGKEVPNYAKKDQSKNKSVFIQVAGDIEDLVYDKFGKNSKEFLSLNKALERW